MLPYKQYLLPAVTKHVETYLEEPETTYEESRRSNHLPLGHEGKGAAPDTPEGEKELEEISHLAPSTVYRWISWLGEKLDAIEDSCRFSACSGLDIDLTPWLKSSVKICSPNRKKTLIRAAQSLTLLKAKEFSTNLAMARCPP